MIYNTQITISSTKPYINGFASVKEDTITRLCSIASEMEDRQVKPHEIILLSDIPTPITGEKIEFDVQWQFVSAG